MQPIIMLTLVGVAAIAMSTGFLAPGFVLNVQQLGAQETLLDSPINTANVDFELAKVETMGASHTQFVNVIEACSFHSPSDIGAGGAIICKLTDKDHDIVAEGRLDLTRTYTGSTTTFIPIEQTAFDFANDVQNIEDVKIVVLGPKPVGFTPQQP